MAHRNSIAGSSSAEVALLQAWHPYGRPQVRRAIRPSIPSRCLPPHHHRRPIPSGGRNDRDLPAGPRRHDAPGFRCNPARPGAHSTGTPGIPTPAQPARMDDKKDRLATSPSSKPTAEPNARIDLIVQHFGHTVRITGSEALRDLRVAEVVQLDIHLEEDGAITYRTKLQVSFKYETES